MARRRVFITGVAGFLGSHLARRMLARGHQVSGCDNLLGGYRDNVPPGVEFHRSDCLSLESMKRLTRGVDLLYHCAAVPYEGLSLFSPHFVSRNLYGATASVVTAAIHNGVGRFIYCSSMARYGNHRVPFTEEMVPRPQDPYGIAKYAGELLLERLAEVHGMEHVIAVPHNIIGPGQRYDDPYRNVAAIMINRMLQGKQPIIYGDGRQKRCFSYIEDVIDPLEALAFRRNVVGEVINIGPDEEFITILQLARTIADLLDFDLKPIHLPPRPQEVRFANCSADKARRLLGYRTRFTLEEGLRAMVEWIQAHGPRPFRYNLDLEIVNERTPVSWTKRLV